jgi:hypothetical protein
VRPDVTRGLTIAAGLVLAVACGGGGGFVDAPSSEPPPPPGTFSVDWTITKSGSAASCMDVGATTVVVTLQDQKTKQNSSASFGCAIGGAVSGAFFPATYDLGFTLTGSGGVIAMGAPQTGIVIQSMMTAHVMPVVFAVP